jgi:phosphocarrier protein
VKEARRTVTIVNRRGLHARASAKFVNAVSQLPDGCRVRVAKDDNEAAGGSILGRMMLGAARGDEIEVIVSGAEPEPVLAELCQLIDGGFGED